MISRVVVVVVAVTALVAMVLSDKMPAAQYKGDGRTGEVGDVAAELAESIPGTAGVDYPIFAQPPETSFVCEGYIQGYYADPEAQCQAFHICGDDGRGGLAKYSFLCPNGTVFNQQYFICDWWFNVDCSQAKELYSRNEEVAAEAAAANSDREGSGAESALGVYGNGNNYF